MEVRRIGNNLPVEWRILRNGNPVDLSRTTSLRILVKGDYGIREVSEYLVSKNTVRWIFYGSEQRLPGTFSFLLIANYDTDVMFTVEATNVLKLVPATSTEYSAEESCDITAESELTVPANGFSAYELALLHGYQGSEEEWLAYLRQPAVDAAGEAEKTVQELVEASSKATEAANATAEAAEKATAAITELGNRLVTAETAREKAESARVQAELLRAQAESARVQAELLRDSAEKQRAAAEELRVKAEQLRVSAEEARAAAEEKRVLAEQSRATAEESRVKAETGRVDAESKRVTAEQSRVTAETSRVKAEQSRVTAEEQREETFATLKADAEKATQDAEDAALLAQENVLAIEFDQSTGTLSAVAGADNSAFTSGEITSDGEVVLNFDYEVTD